MGGDCAVPRRMSAEEMTIRFDELQAGLPAQWRLIASMNREEHAVVAVTSLSLEVELPSTLLQAYEERFLFLLLLLRQPRTRLIYVTSMPVLPEVLDYYLDLLPGVIPSHARRRLTTIAALDGSSRPLTLKILERPRLLRRIREQIIDPATTHLVPFNTTDLEKELAVRLGIPMYAADPKHLDFGSKTGSRRLFAEEGVPYPLGREGIGSIAEAAGAIVAMRAEKPSLEEVLVKLNEGVSGWGNALVDLRGLPAPGSAGEAGGVEERLREMKFELEGTTFETYREALDKEGAVVEERITGEEFRSPSVQMRATPLGELEMLSTHDQLMGGAGGQTFTGCTFPADPAYAPLITRDAAKVGSRLVREGVLGRFGVDYVVVRSAGGDWQAYAIEINLRKGGTTHPYLTLEFLTDGRYDPETATFTAPDGITKHYVASDYQASDMYRLLTPDDLVLHMLTAISEHGRFGLTAVGDTAEEARALYDRAIEGVQEEARLAMEETGEG